MDLIEQFSLYSDQYQICMKAKRYIILRLNKDKAYNNVHTNEAQGRNAYRCHTKYNAIILRGEGVFNTLDLSILLNTYTLRISKTKNITPHEQ